MTEVGPVLVVDDDKLVRAFLTDALSAAGARVAAVESAEKAADVLQQKPILAFVDLNLPGDQGDAFCRSVRMQTDRWDLPVVMITAEEGPAPIRRSFVAGADDYVVKPLTEKQVVAKLAAVRAGLGEREIAPPRSKRVMLGTQKAFFGTLITRLLDKAGFDCCLTTSLAEAQAVTTVGKVALAVVDLDIPAASLLVDWLQHCVPPVPVVAVASHAATATAKLPKFLAELEPYDVETETEHLVRRINKVLAGSVRPERRSAPRVPFHAEVNFRLLGTSEDWTAGGSFDLSETGIYVRTLNPMPASKPVEIRFHLPGDQEWMAVGGVVVWSNPFSPRSVLTYPYGMGVTFSDFPVAQWTRVRDFIQKQKSGS
ncbi:MAG TPA: response regulator [Myxococcales bacterium]|jgi:CheY-like chemotaxis protein/Tfp pilus assembly protein PilZ